MAKQPVSDHEMKLYSFEEARGILKVGKDVFQSYIQEHGLVFVRMPNARLYITHKDLYEFIDRFRCLYSEKPQIFIPPGPQQIQY